MSTPGHELANVLKEISNIEHHLTRLARRRPERGIFKNFRVMKWHQKVYPLLVQADELQQRSIQLQRQIALRLGEEGWPIELAQPDGDEAVEGER